MTNHSIGDFRTRGFVAIGYPPDLRAVVHEVAKLWQGFCALPREVVEKLPYSNDSDGVGLEIKEGEGPKGDFKWNFDVTDQAVGWLERHASAIGDAAALDFIKGAASLVGLLKPSIDAFVRDVETEFGIDGFSKEVSEGGATYFVRFIKYPPGAEPNQETATAHVDQSGFTPHLWESAPGLQYLSLDGKAWDFMPVSEGEMVVIPSMQLQLRSEGKLTALCHRVIATPETAVSGRYSAVVFVQLPQTPKYDKKSHGRLQEKAPGFNYGMPHDEFRRLFMAE